MPSVFPNLLDYAKSLDPDGSIAKVVEMLNRSNVFVERLPVVPGNLTTGHRTTMRSSLPAAIWRKLYQGVPASKSTRAQIEETCGLLEARAEVDARLVKLYDNPNEFRLSEASAFIESMNQTMARTVVYGSTTNGDPFNGLATRYDTQAGEVGKQVVSAGGSGNCTSVFLAVLGENTVHGITPKGAGTGIQHKDLGEYDAFDENQDRYRAVGDQWTWELGLVVRDYRACARIANIAVADLATAGLSGTQGAAAATNLARLIIEAKGRIPSSVRAQGRLVAFMNPRARTALKLIGLEKSVNAMGMGAGMEQLVDAFDGVQFLETDAILNTEAPVA